MLQKLRSYLQMTKPRAMLVVLMTTAAGFVLARGTSFDFLLFVNLLIGTGLQGGGSIVLNQWWERDHDARMPRTWKRPLPAGLVGATEALVYGVALSVVGTAWLLATVNGLTALLGALCVLSYVLVYTPLKRRTPWNTAVGAVPGAIPPMMGWTAITGSIGLEAWLLFAILFVWQYPHFLAIGWLYKDDYAGAGYKMLASRDPQGQKTATQVIVNAALLVVITLLPYRFGHAGGLYAIGAVLLGLGLLAIGIRFAKQRDAVMARWLLRGTIVHISLLVLLMVIDRA